MQAFELTGKSVTLDFSFFISIFYSLSPNSEPTIAPSGVSANSLSSSTIEVTWIPIPWKMGSGRLLGYEVKPNSCCTSSLL